MRVGKTAEAGLGRGPSRKGGRAWQSGAGRDLSGVRNLAADPLRPFLKSWIARQLRAQGFLPRSEDRPDNHRAVLAAGDDGAAVRAERDAGDRLSVPLKRVADRLAGRGIPQA